MDGKGEGIYSATLDSSTGRLTLTGATRGIINPSFVAVAGDVLYAVSEVSTSDGELVAYAIDRRTGELSEINRQSTLGSAPCYVSVVPAGVLVANYGGGSVTMFPRLTRGAVGPPSSHILHTGSSVNPIRQEAPHPHAIVPDPEHRFVLVPDLGTDTVVAYRLDQRRCVMERTGLVNLSAGAGPRHVAFSENGERCYLMAELDSTVTTFAYNRGELKHLQTMGALPAGWQGTPSGADVQIGRNGEYVYASLRGPACIVVLHVTADGLELKARVPTHGTTPRNIGIDPSGEFLIAANQDSDTLEVFRLDEASGIPAHTGENLKVPSPVCVQFG